MSDKQQSSELAPTQPSAPASRSRHRDPLSVLSEMEEMMGRMLGRRWPFGRPLRRFAEASGSSAPQLDMYEEGDQIVVKAELPGISRDDVEVTLESGDLVIKGSAS